ncbi:helix-turn-helix domain-containing protein [Silicimonas sp. MF1-12-2]|uniref:helix-turn-helix domain-containing protein n=1 Tax=Silicimonas sp. MF1-12-2 TaxID=3384793 RepID=UPI0039B3DFFE
MGRRQTEQNSFIRDNFSEIWPVHLAAFTRLLSKLRARFDDDLDLLLIMAVIGERTRPENWAPELLTYRQLTNASDDLNLQLPINIQSLADYTGIPRETVRRKVSILEQKGWIARDSNGRLSVSRTASLDLEDATRDSLIYLDALREVFQSQNGEEQGL